MEKQKLNGIRKVIQELNSEERTRMYQGVYYDFVKDEVQLKKDKKKEFLPKELSGAEQIMIAYPCFVGKYHRVDVESRINIERIKKYMLEC